VPNQETSANLYIQGLKSHRNIIERWPSIVEFGLEKLTLIFLYGGSSIKRDNLQLPETPLYDAPRRIDALGKMMGRIEETRSMQGVSASLHGRKIKESSFNKCTDKWAIFPLSLS
jgi:hypothetical protein